MIKGFCGTDAVERGAGRRANANYGVDGLVQRCETGGSSRVEERNYRGPRKEVSVCKVRPRTYSEGSTNILGLNGVCTTYVSAIEEH